MTGENIVLWTPYSLLVTVIRSGDAGGRLGRILLEPCLQMIICPAQLPDQILELRLA
jgi:hypothetical protein